VARSKRSKQLELEIRTWGGKRKNAGRKRVAIRPRVPHLRRPELHRSHPVLVTVRICDGVPSLRQPAHLIVEAEDRDSLSRGMRGLNTRLAKRLNKLFGRRGKLIDGRYHARDLRTPLEVRSALGYVLFNAARHCAKANRPAPRTVVDPYSSATRFTGRRRQPDAEEHARDLGTSSARTWLLRVGWKRHGLIDPREARAP
jgi:putative transposase